MQKYQYNVKTWPCWKNCGFVGHTLGEAYKHYKENPTHRRRPKKLLSAKNPQFYRAPAQTPKLLDMLREDIRRRTVELDSVKQALDLLKQVIKD